MPNLLILESPSKAPTIKSFLGNNYHVVATVGHVRDLPKSSLGIDVDNGFEPHFISIRGKGDLIENLKKEAKKATKIYLATDPDREGEGIAWHLSQLLDIPEDSLCRVTFNEITSSYVKKAIKKPRKIDMALVDSQKTRRILDRIVGYQLTPYLWSNVQSGLSAGRVQSHATKVICDREEEINSFIPQEYWTLSGNASIKGITIKIRFPSNFDSEEDVNQVLSSIQGKDLLVKQVKNSEKKKSPLAPFTTSTLQIDASRKLGFHSQQTMSLAQELFEGVDLGTNFGGTHGIITYIRTDSTRISEEAQEDTKKYISDIYGDAYVPSEANIYKTKNGAQDAHEAIRPVDVKLTPESIKDRLSHNQYLLYKLIWERFMASQMTPIVYDTTTIDFECESYTFKASSYQIKFNGYSILYEDLDKGDFENDEIGKFPEMKEGETISSYSLQKIQHFTEPPARYNDATFVKYLEDSGVGRPSTYASILSTIISRGYVEREGKSLIPTQLGVVTTNLMVQNFPEIVDRDFTAELEEKLDLIANGKNSSQELLSNFYSKFKKDLDKAMSEETKVQVPVEESDMECPNCGKKLIYKKGRFGEYLACPNYPKCRTTITLDKNRNPVQKKAKPEPEKTDLVCEICGSPLVVRNGRFGEFYACSNFPTCRFTKQKIQKIGVKCTVCGGDILVRHSKDGKIFYSCENYPTCNFSTWDMPLDEKCPKCGTQLQYRKYKNLVLCPNDDCDYQLEEKRDV